MKKRTSVAPMKSTLAKSAPKFTERDRELFTAYQRSGEGNTLTAREYSDLLRAALHAVADAHPAASVTAYAMKWVAEQWGEPGLTATPLAFVWRTASAYAAIVDNLPERKLETGEERREAIEATNDRVVEILDAITLYEMEAGDVSGDYHIATRADSDEDWIDPAAIARAAREHLAELRATPAVSIEDFYVERIGDGGRQFANKVTLALRAAGGLEKLHCTKGRVMILDREEFERTVAKRRLDCSDPLCTNDHGAVSLTWDHVEDLVEDGRIAICIREEESAMSRRMKHVIVYNSPSTVESGVFEKNMAMRDVDYGFEVRA